MVLAPYLKLPTAGGGTGNGAIEGGLLAPVAYTLDGGWSLFMTPEVDVLRDASGTASHVQLANDVSVGYALLLARSLKIDGGFPPAVAAYWQRLQDRDGFKRAKAAQKNDSVAAPQFPT